MAIHRVSVEWTGFPGAPGYTNFFFAGEADPTIALSSTARVAEFLSALTDLIPDDVAFSLPRTVDNLDETTGSLIGYATMTEGVSWQQPSAPGAYSGPTGAHINWLTSQVVNGRLLRGRTFLVPLAGSVFDTSGTLTNSALENIRSAAALMIFEPGENSMVVWSRPRDGRPGQAADVTGYEVPDHASVLRSRRD